jgi:hypothetical protein
MKEQFLNTISLCLSKTPLAIISDCGIFFYIPPELSQEDAEEVVKEVQSWPNAVVEVINSPKTQKRILLVSSWRMQ